MKWALMVDRGKRKGMMIPIQKSPFLIGRNDECQIRAANPCVSHRHCELLTEDDKIAARDCKSTNGTLHQFPTDRGPSRAPRRRLSQSRLDGFSRLPRRSQIH